MNQYLIWSDLHLDHWGDHGRAAIVRRLVTAHKQHPAALVLLAGDIAENEELMVRFFKILDEANIHFRWIPGNHDYYGKTIDALPNFWDDENIGVVAATVWTNFNRQQAFAPLIFRQINDPYHIKKGDRFIQADDLIKAHQDQLEFIRRSPSPVVMTHFPLFQQSIADRFKTDPLNSYFVNDTDPSITFGRKLFVHGHVHDAFDYEIEGVRVVCNPLGYPGEARNESQLNPKLIVIGS